MSFMERSLRSFIVIKAAKKLKVEIEKVGLEDLKYAAQEGISIVGTYLNGCSPKEQVIIRREFNNLVRAGVTPEMVLTELIKQMPELAPVIEGKDDYKRSEIEKLNLFLQGVKQS